VYKGIAGVAQGDVLSSTASPAIEEARAELQQVLQAPSFARSPGLSRLLSYLCEKALAGEIDQIKEYSIALDVFGRPDSFDQDADSIVRVQANRLRKHLTDYYAGQGKFHRLRIAIPVGKYVPAFEEHLENHRHELAGRGEVAQNQSRKHWVAWAAWIAAAVLLAIATLSIMVGRHRPTRGQLDQSPANSVEPATPMFGLPVGDEIRILAGSNRNYVDRSGKLWAPDAYFSGGTVVHSAVQHVWRTQDPTIYRSSRQGDFRYDIPLKPAVYELRLHFAETFYGPEDAGGGGEGSRIMSIAANGKPLLSDFDVLADSSGGRTADVKVFTDVAPEKDGVLHLAFSSVNGRGMVSAIEILPGYRGRMRPVRIVARDVPYYSNDSQWWSADIYFKGGQLAASEETASGTDDPEFYETERWGHFSYAIPVPPGEYTLALHFIERGLPIAGDHPEGGAGPDRVFDVFCNGNAIFRGLNLERESGKNRPMIKKTSGLVPNAQGKLLLEFVPLSHYATVSAIEVLPQ
jgi:malectin (di-glucose binding ER protein)